MDAAWSFGARWGPAGGGLQSHGPEGQEKKSTPQGPPWHTGRAHTQLSDPGAPPSAEAGGAV